MLDAGVEIVAELTLEQLLAALGPRRVLRQLGDATAGAFYHHFPDRAAYVWAVVEHGLTTDADAVVGDVVRDLLEIVDGPAPQVIEEITRVCRLDFRRRTTVGSMAERLRLCVWLAQAEPAARAALRDRYERSTAQYEAVYERVLERWGREFRPPFTARSAAAVFMGLLEGLVIRHGVDPENADPALYALAVTALLPTVTRPIGDDESVDGSVAHMARFRGGPSRAEADTDARRRLLDVALARMDEGSYRDSSAEDLATEAGVSPAAVYEEFRGKPGLAAATFAQFLPLLERPLRSELDGGEAVPDTIRRHLERLAELASRHRGLTNAVLDAVQNATIRYGSHIGPNDPRAIVPLPQVLVPAIEAGQEQGVVRADFDAFELAALTTNLMLLRIMTRPEEDSTDAAAIVSEVVLSGMAVRG